MGAVDIKRFVNLVSAHVRRYNKDILYRFMEGKVYDPKLTWWWYLYTTGKDNISRLFKELEQESVMQDTKPSKNPALAMLRNRLSKERLEELGLS